MLPIVLAWENFKDRLSATVGLTHWDLHVILGIGLFFLFGRLMRRTPASFLSLIPVALLEFANETLDYLRAYYGRWYWNYPDTAIEVLLTVGPSLAVIFVARCAPVIRRTAARMWFNLRFPPRRDHIDVQERHD